MKPRYILLIFSLLFLFIFFISINAQAINSNQVINLGGKTFSPLNKTSINYQQSVFLTQEGKHKLVVSAKDLSTSNPRIIVTPTTNIDAIPVITGKVDPIMDVPDEPTDNLPPSSYLPDKMYNDVGYTPGFDPIEYFGTNNQNQNTDATTVANLWGTAPLTGSYHIPVLLVEFGDFSHTLPSSTFTDQFNSNYYLNGEGTSVSKYYYHESYGTLDITYDIYDWRTLTSHSYNWYGTGNNAFQFILDSVNLFGTGPNAIDFTQYDSDNDGRIDGIVVLHAGYAQEYMGAGHMKSQTRIFNGSTNYSIQGLYYGNVSLVEEKLAPSFCSTYITAYNYPSDCRGPVLTETHEFAHLLGLPDLYQVHPTTGSQVGAGLGDITMMSQQDRYPQKPINFDAWSRYFFGWIGPTDIDGSMSGNYTLTSIDASPNSAYILRDDSKMNSQEFFLVANRYRSNYNQDKWLFGGLVNGQIYNIYGGLEIYHVDEQYISNNYLTNTIMYDADMNMYDDTISHPGIVFEQNILNDFSNNVMISYGDFYTNEYNIFFNNPTWGYFDNIERIQPPYCSWDTTSHAYTGLQDTGVKVEALSVSGYNVLAYLQSEMGPFNLFITYPKNNKWYKYNHLIDFTVNMNNYTGTVSCVWKKSNGDIISNECEFSATPSTLNLGSTGCSGSHELTVTATDSGTGSQATDEVHIKVYKNFEEVCEPMPTTRLD